jgi:hypothetical protein
MEAPTGLLDIAVQHAVMVTVDTRSSACHLTLSVAPLHCPQSLRGVHCLTHTHGGAGPRVKRQYTCGTSPRRSVPSLAWDRVFARSVVGGCAHQLYRCREGWRRAVRGWEDVACWCSHRGGQKSGKP